MSQSSAAPAITHNKSPGILSLIGDTPLVEATQFDTGPCRLFLKLENQNPGGSIKDRIALSMIEAAEAEGKLEPGGTVIEATAGNTGLGLALVADFRVTCQEARFSANFNRLGFHPGFGLTATLPRLVGAQQAALLFYTGRRIPGGSIWISLTRAAVRTACRSFHRRPPGTSSNIIRIRPASPR